MTTPTADFDHRVLLLTPTRRDAETSRDLLAGRGVNAQVCASLEELCEEAERGAGALLVTQEAIFSNREQCLTRLIR